MPYTSENTPYAKGSDTSREAAESQVGKHLDNWRIIECLALLGGLTTDEIEVQLGMLHQTASARVKDLKDAGLLYIDVDKRKTRTGRWAHVNFLSLAGKARAAA